MSVHLSLFLKIQPTGMFKKRLKLIITLVMFHVGLILEVDDESIRMRPVYQVDDTYVEWILHLHDPEKSSSKQRCIMKRSAIASTHCWRSDQETTPATRR